MRRKFFVCAVDSLENAKLILPVYKELLKRRDELRIEMTLLMDMSGDAVDFVKGEDIFFEPIAVDEGLKQLDSAGKIYGLKFDDWKPCVVIFGITPPADNYFRLRFSALSQERGIPTFWIDKGATEEVLEVLFEEFLT